MCESRKCLMSKELAVLSQQPQKKKKKKKKVKTAVAKELNSGKFGEMVLRSSTYYGSITDPFNVHGAKIPDLVTYPSTTFSIVDRRTLTVNASGMVSIVYGVCGGAATALDTCGLVPCRNANGTDDYFVGMIGNPSTSLFPAGGGFTPLTFAQWSVANPTIPTAFNKARLVSAGMAVDYLGAPLNASGTITIASVPRRTLSAKQQATGLSLTDIQNLVGARVIPIPKQTGGMCIYTPQDNVSYEYQTLTDVVTITSVEQLPERMLGGEMYAVISGAVKDDLVQVTAVFNYEAIPQQNTLNIVQPETSKSDPLELSAIMNRIDGVPKAHIGTGPANGMITGSTQLKTPGGQSSAVTKTKPEVGNQVSGDTITEKLLGGAESIEQIIDKGLALGKKVAPLAEIALSLL